MNLIEIYKTLPTEESAIKFLESILWEDSPICPYCQSKYDTAIKGSKRYHCNTCNTSYSVTVNTIFHRTKVDIQKWIYLLLLLSSGKKIPSLRKLEGELTVTKDTVSKMINKIRDRYIDDKILIDKILNQIHHGK